MEMRNAGGSGPQRPQLDPSHRPVFLKRTAVKTGSEATGYVFVRKPKGLAQGITSKSMLTEIDIPVGGVVFRF